MTDKDERDEQVGDGAEDLVHDRDGTIVADHGVSTFFRGEHETREAGSERGEDEDKEEKGADATAGQTPDTSRVEGLRCGRVSALAHAIREAHTDRARRL